MLLLLFSVSSSIRRSPFWFVDSFIVFLTSVADLPVIAATLFSSGVAAVRPLPFAAFFLEAEEAGLVCVVSIVCVEF